RRQFCVQRLVALPRSANGGAKLLAPNVELAAVCAQAWTSRIEVRVQRRARRILRRDTMKRIDEAMHVRRAHHCGAVLRGFAVRLRAARRSEYQYRDHSNGGRPRQKTGEVGRWSAIDSICRL